MSLDTAEINSLFGRGVVQDAIARRFQFRRWEDDTRNLTAVIKAIQDIEERIESPHDAVAYCQGLDEMVRGCVIFAVIKADL